MRSVRLHPAVVVAVLLVLAGCMGGVTIPGITAAVTAPPTTSTQTTTASQPTTPNDTLEVHFINVGQSISTLLIGPTGETMLIDTGHYQDDGEDVLSYLKRKNITRIDYLVVSHNDADHIGGNAQIINYYETKANGIGAIYDPGIAASTQTYSAYLDAVEKHDVPLYVTRAGDTIPFEGVNVSVLGPPKPYLEDRTRNENNIVLKIGFGQTSFLLTGDAEAAQEQCLVETYDDRLNVTILKAGHHGSKTSTSAALLSATTPKAVVVSSAYDSQYGHPHEEVLQRLAERKIPTYWTATHGNIALVSDGKQVTIKTQQAAPTAPRNLRDGAAIDPRATGTLEVQETISGEKHPTQTPSTTVATDGGTDGATSNLEIAEIHGDASGDESQNLNDEYIVLKNTGETTLDLGSWTVTDAAGHEYTFPKDFQLEAGATVTLHTGSGTDTESDLHWGSGSAVWNNGGDTIIVRNDQGNRILVEEYS